jgi:hypothetical protein
MTRKTLKIKRLALKGEGGISVGMSGFFPEFSLLFVARKATGSADDLIFLQRNPKNSIISLQPGTTISVEHRFSRRL